MKIKSFFRRKFKKKKNTHIILTKNDLIFLEYELSKSKIIGIDTEFDWRTTYFPNLSLVQIATETELFLIDCLKLSPHLILKKYLEDKNLLKIFHSVRSDTTVLSKCLDCRTENVFDIQLADRMLTKGDIKSYGKIVNKYFGIKLKKTETNSNWLRRPLSDEQIKYAFDDIDFLLEIYKYQFKSLLKEGLLSKVLLYSEKEANLGNQSLKEIRLNKIQNKFSKRNMDIFIWREDLAEEKNIPPAYIFKDKNLKKLSKIDPNDDNAKRKIMTIFGDTYLTERFISTFL